MCFEGLHSVHSGKTQTVNVEEAPAGLLDELSSQAAVRHCQSRICGDQLTHCVTQGSARIPRPQICLGRVEHDRAFQCVSHIVATYMQRAGITCQRGLATAGSLHRWLGPVV